MLNIFKGYKNKTKTQNNVALHYLLTSWLKDLRHLAGSPAWYHTWVHELIYQWMRGIQLSLSTKLPSLANQKKTGVGLESCWTKMVCRLESKIMILGQTSELIKDLNRSGSGHGQKQTEMASLLEALLEVKRTRCFCSLCLRKLMYATSVKTCYHITNKTPNLTRHERLSSVCFYKFCHFKHSKDFKPFEWKGSSSGPWAPSSVLTLLTSFHA